MPTGNKAMTEIRKVTKLFAAETKAIDDHRIHAVLSTEAKDRDGDILRVAGWNLDNFMKHPVLLSSHNYGSLLSQIGEWEDVSVKSKRLEGVAKYYVGQGNDEADWGHTIAREGKAAYSVGFIPDMSLAKELKGDSDWFINYEFNGQELLETSHVTIPSNQDALQTAKAKGLIHPAVLDIYGLGDGREHLALAKVWAQIEEEITKSVHGEHGHDDNGSHTHEEDKKSPFDAEQDEWLALLFESLIGKRLEAIEEALEPLVKLLHTHPGGPEGEKHPVDYVQIFRQSAEEAVHG